MGIDFKPNKPIYKQLMDRITSEIVRGEMVAGEKLPSVREYAINVGVNANTIQRVYQELEGLEIVETKRGQGTFVTENKRRLNRLREDLKLTLIREFIEDMKSMGFQLDDMIKGMESEGKDDK